MCLVRYRKKIKLKSFDGAGLQGHCMYEVSVVHSHSHADFNLNCCVGNDSLSVRYSGFKVYGNCCC